jgi:hypothetical protein
LPYAEVSNDVNGTVFQIIVFADILVKVNGFKVSTATETRPLGREEK